MKFTNSKIIKKPFLNQ